MNQSKSVIQLKDNKVIELIEKFLYSKAYLVFLALLTFLSNAFSWEFPVYIFVCLLLLYITLFCRDLLPALPIPIFMYFSPSWANNPGVNANSIFYPEHGLYVIIAAIAVAVAGIVVRIVLREKKEFFTHKRALIPGFIALAVTFLLGGIGTKFYIFENFRYVLLLLVSLFALYYLFTGTVDWAEVKKDYVCWLGFILGMLLLLELIYIFTFAKGGMFNPYKQVLLNVFQDGKIVRNNVHTGWGIHNNIAGMMCVMLPFFFYFAGTRKYGFIYNLLAHLLCFGIFCTISRTSMLSAGIVYVICAVVLLVRKQNRLQNAIVFGTLIAGALLAVGSVLLLAQGQGRLAELAKKLISSLMNKFDQLLQLGFIDNDRLKNYSTALQQFSENPVFGNAFYSCNAYQFVYVQKMTFLPARWHNTICQVLASCGIVGLTGYFYHRVQTVRVFFKSFGFSKFFVFLSFLSILGISMLDCHLFNLGPGLIYSLLLCFAEKMEKQPGDDFLDWSKQKQK